MPEFKQRHWIEVRPIGPISPIGPILLILPILLTILFSPLCRAAGPVTTTLVPALGWDAGKQGGFPVSLAADFSGNIWVGTEGNGLWKYDPVKKGWTQFTTADGLGDDCVYALAVDQQGRVWAGHLNHGVSVYNGDKWRNYGLLDGPIGDRVFAIAFSPKDGDVWMATDMGLARYSEKRQDWDYYTRASGLPSDQIQGIAFDDNGVIYAGTQCNGIAIAGPDDDFKKWHTVTGPSQPPQASMGEGLPSNLINDLLLIPAPDNKSSIAALTPNGASARADGDNWAFIRSRHANQPLFAAGTPGLVDPSQFNLTMPAEDWMTTGLATGTNVWVAYRKSGIECRDAVNSAAPDLVATVSGSGSAIIRSILILPNQVPLFAAYDEVAGGLLTLSGSPATTGTSVPSPNQQSSISIHQSPPPPLPAPFPPPTVDEANALATRLGKFTQQLAPGEAYYLADDWRTQGDWIGRYGNAYVKLCGMAQGDQDYSLQPGYQISLQVGPHHEASAAGPVWYHDNDSSDDIRSLYDPILGHRRDAEENDYSYDTKTYPESYDGPDLWVRVKVPDGIHCVSLYFVNNDAHTKGGNKYRDYDVQILPGDQDDAAIQAATPLARTRVTDFWGGVYKQFLVCGPADYVVRVGRNRSFVTKLQGVFVDRVAPEPADPPAHLPGFDTVLYDMPDAPTDYHPTALADAAVNLWGQLDDALNVRGAIPLEMPLHIWCYRAAVAGQAPAAVLERLRWEIAIWTPEDRKKFDEAMKAAHDAAR